MKRIYYKGQELLPVKYDIVFKAIFLGDGDMELLASLLSSILDTQMSAGDIAVLNTELPPIHAEGKPSRMDLRVKTSEGQHLNIELQLKNEYNIDKRSVYYTSKLYADQMTARMGFDELCPAIAINILDFKHLPYDEYHNRYRLKNIRTHDELTDVFEVNFIELPKVPKTPGGELKDLWAQFIAADSEEALSMLTNQNPVFEKAVNKLVYVSADEKLRYEMDMRQKAELDYRSAMKTNLKKGRAEGIAEGRVEIAKKMVSMGIDAAQIAEATGLTIEEVGEL